MWRVRVCLAGGGREHVGYFLNEEEGALAYQRALNRIREFSIMLHFRMLRNMVEKGFAQTVFGCHS